MSSKHKNQSTEFDLHIWRKPESKNMAELFTVSVGKKSICVDMPIDQALDFIRSEMEGQNNQ